MGLFGIANAVLTKMRSSSIELRSQSLSLHNTIIMSALETSIARI